MKFLIFFWVNGRCWAQPTHAVNMIVPPWGFKWHIKMGVGEGGPSKHHETPLNPPLTSAIDVDVLLLGCLVKTVKIINFIKQFLNLAVNTAFG